MQRFDYIIAGGGLAGLSLAYQLNQTILKEKSILIIDKNPKTENDRTWCFWEKGNEGLFDEIVHRKWSSVYFHGTDFSKLLPISPYEYKWIRGIDFYQFVKENLLKNSNIVFIQDSIERIKDTPNGGFVITKNSQYIADFVFDSVTPLQLNLPRFHHLLQHFKGWEIQTEKPVFDPKSPTMMDYRVEQMGLGVRFMYVLPESTTRAMVEYTVFSDKLLSDFEYDIELRKYIRDFLKIENYSIEHKEFGVIPMSDVDTPERVGEHVMRIGTSGGYVKASTGYAFSRTQRKNQEIVRNLLTTGKPFRKRKTIKQYFKKRLDSVFLNVLLKNRFSGKDVFTALYQKNDTPTLFAFLDEDSSILADLRIMATVPLWAFTKAAFDVLLKRY